MSVGEPPAPPQAPNSNVAARTLAISFFIVTSNESSGSPGARMAGVREHNLAMKEWHQLRLVLWSLALALVLSFAFPSLAAASTPVVKCGKVTAYVAGSATTSASLTVDDVTFVVGLPGGAATPSTASLTVPNPNPQVGQSVCIRGLVDPLPGGFQLLSGDIAIASGGPSISVGLPNTSTAPQPDELNLALLVVAAVVAAGLLVVRRRSSPTA